MTHFAVMIPARNERDRLRATVESVRRTVANACATEQIVIVDDGSRDDTASVARALECDVVVRPDRGYSALGRPELAETHNAGFDHITSVFREPTFVFVVGADTQFAPDYLSILLSEMAADDALAVCSGLLPGDRLAPHAVRGSGRIIRQSFWRSLGQRLPVCYFAWESYPLVVANARGLRTAHFERAHMFTERPPMRRVNWECYGKAMRENGSLPTHVIARAGLQALSGEVRNAGALLAGYAKGSGVRYPADLRRYVRGYQARRAISSLIGR